MGIKRRLIVSSIAAVALVAATLLVRQEPDPVYGDANCKLGPAFLMMNVVCDFGIETRGWPLPVTVVSQVYSGNLPTQFELAPALADFVLALLAIFAAQTLWQILIPQLRQSSILRRKLELSLLAAIGLTAVSLLYRTGPTSLEPMPYGPTYGPDHILNGAIAVRNPVASRGYPWPAVSISPDEDQPQAYYRGFQPLGALGDLAVYFIVSFPVVSFLTRPKNSLSINKVTPK